MSKQPAFTERMIDWVMEELRVEPTQLTQYLNEIIFQHTVDTHTTETKYLVHSFSMKMKAFRLVLLGHMTNSELRSELSDAFNQFAVTGRKFWRSTKLRFNKQCSRCSPTSKKWQLEPRTENNSSSRATVM